MRTVTITDSNLYKKLIKRGEFILRGRELSKKIEKWESERAKLGLQAQKIQDKIIPQIEKLVEADLGEFEQAVGFNPTKEGSIEVMIADRVEDFKEAYRKSVAERKK